MSKTKQKERSEVEYLRGEIRRLKSENRNLRKRIKDVQKREHLYEISSEELYDSDVETGPIAPRCPKCNALDLVYIDLGRYTLEKCNSCEYRKKRNVSGNDSSEKKNKKS